jgi:hypothetical protein
MFSLHLNLKHKSILSFNVDLMIYLAPIGT